MSMDLPKGVDRIVVSQGEVLVRTARDFDPASLALAVGTNEVPFDPVSGPEATRFSMTLRPAFDGDDLLRPRDEQDGAAATCWLNKLPDWKLLHRDTLQLRVETPLQPFAIDFAATICCPAGSGAMVFRAGIAAHRAQATFILRVRDEATGIVTVSSHRFDGQHRGGHHADGYQQIALRLPESDGERTVSFSFLYEGFDGPADQKNPHLFVADPVVESAGSEALRNTGLVLTGPAISGETAWYVAPLPAILAPGASLTLLAGKDEVALLAGTDTVVHLVDDRAHSIVLSASTLGSFSICIDGQTALRTMLGPTPAELRIPARFQTGGLHHLTVWDEGRAQLFLSAEVLLPSVITPNDVLQREGQGEWAGPLSAQGTHRYGALKAQMARGLSPETQRQVIGALTALEAGPQNLVFEALVFEPPKAPEVSIIIPAHDNFAWTYLTLCSLLLAPNETGYEVVIVDDGSTDDTTTIEELVSGVQVVRNMKPQGFLRACNLGAEMSSAPYLVFLNNDVEVTSGWLDALLETVREDDSIGLAGAKLLYPDGRLQEAGGILWRNGNPWNYGRGCNPWEPRFCYAREADYVSGAAMLTPRAVWQEVGGFSRYLEPMYFEDTDYACKVRESGRRIRFVPASIVYHAEGTTSGVDITSGPKRYQEINRPKFKRRWIASLTQHRPEGVEPDLEKDRGVARRVLMIDYQTPRPDRDAGSYAAIQEIRLLQSLGFKVTFLAKNLAHLGQYTENLQRMGVEVIYAPFFLSIPEYLAQHAAEFDLYYLTRYHIAQEITPVIRQLAPGRKIILNIADLHFLRELRAARHAGDEAAIAAAGATRAAEVEAIAGVDLVLSYSETELAVIESHIDGTVAMARCPWVVHVPHKAPKLAGRQGISFLGSFLHHPNSEAVAWFVSDVMPELEGTPFHIYGADMDRGIRDLESETILPHGYIKDTATAFDKHRVFVAPLRSGAGIKGKVLAAAAHGIPCVLSPIAAEGTGLVDGQTCLVAETSEDWVSAIRRLIGDDALWTRMSSEARDYVGTAYSFETGRQRLRTILETLDIYPT